MSSPRVIFLIFTLIFIFSVFILYKDKSTLILSTVSSALIIYTILYKEYLDIKDEKTHTNNYEHDPDRNSNIFTAFADSDLKYVDKFLDGDKITSDKITSDKITSDKKTKSKFDSVNPEFPQFKVYEGSVRQQNDELAKTKYPQMNDINNKIVKKNGINYDEQFTYQAVERARPRKDILGMIAANSTNRAPLFVEELDEQERREWWGGADT